MVDWKTNESTLRDGRAGAQPHALLGGEAGLSARGAGAALARGALPECVFLSRMLALALACALAASLVLAGCTVTKPEELASTQAASSSPAAAQASSAAEGTSAAQASSEQAAGGAPVAGLRFQQAAIDGKKVVVSKADIEDNATFINYDADGTTVQLIAVRSTDGTPHVALNTCQSCNPSPKAHFLQDGTTLTCQNCGLEFSVDTVGAVGASSCNPAPIADLAETDDTFTIPTAVLDAYAPAFEQWQGPTA